LEIKQKTYLFGKKNLEQMFKRKVTDLNTQVTATLQRLSCALKNASCCLAVASTIGH
jgi:hypothetical protein